MNILIAPALFLFNGWMYGMGIVAQSRCVKNTSQMWSFSAQKLPGALRSQSKSKALGAPKALHTLFHCLPDLICTPSPLYLSHSGGSSHIGLLVGPQTQQVCPCRRAFALAVPRPGKLFPQTPAWLPPSAPLLKCGLHGKTFHDLLSTVAPVSVLFSLLTLPDFFYITYLHLAWGRSVFVCLLLLMSAPSGRALFCSPLFTQRLEQCPAQNFFFNEKRTVASRESALIGAPGPRSLPQPSHGSPAPTGEHRPAPPKGCKASALTPFCPSSLAQGQRTCSSLHQEYSPLHGPLASSETPSSGKPASYSEAKSDLPALLSQQQPATSSRKCWGASLPGPARQGKAGEAAREVITRANTCSTLSWPDPGAKQLNFPAMFFQCVPSAILWG